MHVSVLYMLSAIAFYQWIYFFIFLVSFYVVFFFILFFFYYFEWKFPISDYFLYERILVKFEAVSLEELDTQIQGECRPQPFSRNGKYISG